MLTNVIGNFLTPSLPSPTEKRKLIVERPHGESLTSVDALCKINQKEKRSFKRKKYTSAVAKEATKIRKAPAKRYDLHESDTKESFDINTGLIRPLIKLNRTAPSHKLMKKE